MNFSLKARLKETVSQDRQLHACEVDSENTISKYSNISLLIPPDTFMVNICGKL